MINTYDILETIRMIQDECLDIRTTTMGISLLDCADTDIDKACAKVYDKICTKAEKLVQTGEDIEREYGIPIINKRVSVTPIAIMAGISGGDPVKYALALEKAARTIGVNFIGGYSALVQKGFAAGDRELIDSIPRALAETEHICSSVNIGSTKAGINMDAVKLMGQKVKEAAELTKENDCIGAGKLVVFCNAPEDNPFMAGAFHGVSEPDCVINVGVSGPGVVRAAVAKFPDYSINDIAELIKKTAFPYGSAGRRRGLSAAGRALWHCGPVPGPHPGGRRLRGPYFGRDWPGKVRRRRHHSLPGYAQRCSQERRRDGLLQRRRPVRRLYPGI